GFDGVAQVGGYLDRVVIAGIAAEVTGGEVGLGALIGVEEAPVLAVDVEVVEVAALALPAHGQLGVARELVAQAGEAGAPVEAPGVVLGGAQVGVVEAGGGAVAAHDGVIEGGVAVIVAEIEVEGVLGVVALAAVAAADADAGVGLDVGGGAVGVEELDGG